MEILNKETIYFSRNCCSQVEQIREMDTFSPILMAIVVLASFGYFLHSARAFTAAYCRLGIASKQELTDFISLSSAQQIEWIISHEIFYSVIERLGDEKYVHFNVLTKLSTLQLRLQEYPDSYYYKETIPEKKPVYLLDHVTDWKSQFGAITRILLKRPTQTDLKWKAERIAAGLKYIYYVFGTD